MLKNMQNFRREHTHDHHRKKDGRDRRNVRFKSHDRGTILEWLLIHLRENVRDDDNNKYAMIIRRGRGGG